MPSKRSADRLKFLRFDHRSYFARKQLIRFSILIAGVLVANTFLLGDQSMLTLLQLKRTNADLATRIDEAEGTVDSLRTVAAEMENDPAAIERVAREKYRMIGEDEKQYLFIGIPDSDRERLLTEVRREEAETAREAEEE